MPSCATCSKPPSRAWKDYSLTLIKRLMSPACGRPVLGATAKIIRNRRSADWQTDDDTPFDPELYRRWLVIERLNAWLDGFKALLVRYETSLQSWLALHWLAFTVLLLRKIAPPPTS